MRCFGSEDAKFTMTSHRCCRKCHERTSPKGRFSCQDANSHDEDPGKNRPFESMCLASQTKILLRASFAHHLDALGKEKPYSLPVLEKGEDGQESSLGDISGCSRQVFLKFLEVCGLTNTCKLLVVQTYKALSTQHTIYSS